VGGKRPDEHMNFSRIDENSNGLAILPSNVTVRLVTCKLRGVILLPIRSIQMTLQYSSETPTLSYIS
jgi:hypothetical protein